MLLKVNRLENLVCYIKNVGVAGFEPATSSSQTRRDDRATLHPEYLIKSGEEGIRTPGTRKGTTP